MAWTTPGTAVAGDVLTASYWNTQVRDNMIELAPFSAAWTAWTPTWGGLTIGNATVQARYLKVGKAVWFNARAVLGSTSSVSGDLSFTLPVTGTTSISSITVYGQFIDASPLNVYPIVADAGSSQVALRAISASGTYALWAIASSTIPFTWTTGDQILCSGFYEAA